MSPPAAGAPPLRPRRRRRLAAAVRALAAEEARPAEPSGGLAAFAKKIGMGAAPAASDGPVLAGLRAIARDRLGEVPADADPPELLARIAGQAPIPADVCVAAGAILLPLLRLARAPEGKDA